MIQPLSDSELQAGKRATKFQATKSPAVTGLNAKSTTHKTIIHNPKSKTSHFIKLA